MDTKEEILEVTIKFIIAGLGNSWILHECLTHYKLDDIPHDQILYRLNRAALQIDDYISAREEIWSHIHNKEYRKAKEAMLEFSVLCSLVGSAANIEIELEIENREWENSEKSK